MANILKVQEKQAILSLAAQGWSGRRIARELGVDRKTIRRYLRLQEAADSKSPRVSTPGSPTSEESKSPISIPGSQGDCDSEKTPPTNNGRRSLCEGYEELILSKFQAGLTAIRIYQDLRQESDFPGSYQSVKRFLQRQKAANPRRVWRVEVQPAEEVQVDFGTGAPIITVEGRRRRPWILRVVLSYSRKAYSEAVLGQSTENFIRCLENAFRHFGGVAKIINLDNLKAGVLKAHWLDPELNPKLQSFCGHYGTSLWPCRPRTPEHKGKTERGIGYLKSNALAARSFESLAAQNEFLLRWETTVADQRIHGTTRQQVAARFAQEKPSLLPLPPDLFPCFKEAKRCVHRDSYIEVQKAYYSVPQKYIGREVWTRWDSREVRIFDLQWNQIILHCRLEPGRFTQCLGLAGGKGSLEEQINYWLERATELGGPCGQWAKGLVQRNGPIALRTIMGLIRLSDDHSFKALNHACAAALSHGAWRLRDVRSLADKPQIQTHFQFAQSHPLIRDLCEYGLFIKTQSNL